MIPIKSLISIDRQCTRPVYLQIAQSVVKQIQNGIIKSGTQLPGSRVMAELLNVHRKTINKAIEELESQGWVEVVPYKGAFIVQHLPEVKARPFIRQQNKQLPKQHQASFPFYKTPFIQPARADRMHIGFNDGSPDVRLAPLEEMARAYTRNLRRLPSKNLLSYDDPMGSEALRKTLAKEFNLTKGLNVDENNILITRGSQMGIFLSGRALLQPGNIAVVGETNYFVANMTFKEMGAKLKYIPVDEDGICVEAIEPICKQQPIKAVYVTSHHHHPTTVTLSPERRIRLLALAQKYHFAIIEDDYDYDFHYCNSPVLPLASADRNGNVIYIGSFSKTTAPAFRVGYIIGPQVFIKEIAKHRRIIDRQGDKVLELAFKDLMDQGILRRYLKKALRQYKVRRDFACELLQSQLSSVIDFKKPDGGMSIWAKFDKSIHLPTLSEEAIKNGIYLSNGLNYNPVDQQLNATRLGFASLNLEEIERSVMGLKRVIMK